MLSERRHGPRREHGRGPAPAGSRRPRGGTAPWRIEGRRRVCFGENGDIGCLKFLSCKHKQFARASRLGPWTAQAMSGAEPSAGGGDAGEIIDAVEVEPSNPGASFLAKVTVAMGVAVTVTAISIFVKQPSSGFSFSLSQIIDASAQSDTIRYTFSQFAKKVIILEYTQGWVYFWLLMDAGFGLFISEEALNVWVCPLYWYLRLFSQMAHCLPSSLNWHSICMRNEFGKT
ncbi:uncharacterized protein LOC123407835 isoform X2 [Hordeum vulgare subsp. vulgare]|uniref:uncharacterized protein LOC123407835 isoform X2 n=1 Tax=Hordeum vulgare subsp. vulgare TaxID=112509 RepID=UPI001D1A50B1|nr:uncharacterized protein LOC123407835 isoform X2 [Hordeum vulgare subsp. vulgare]